MTPYKGVLPPLTKEEFDDLRRSIESRGWDANEGSPRATEDGRLLDGHNRLAIKPDAPVAIVPDSSSWTDEECEAWILRNADPKRNLSPDQKEEKRRRQVELARHFLHNGWTQEAVALAIGKSQEWVAKYRTIITSNSGSIDNRVKVDKSEWASIKARHDSGDTQAQIAADYGVTQKAISKILSRIAKAEEKDRLAEEGAPEKEKASKADLADAAAELEALPPAEGQSEWEVIDGDCLDVLPRLEGVRLMFADPPYNIGIDYGDGEDADRLDDYRDWLREWVRLAASSLADDGSLWLLINWEYAGHYQLAIEDAGLTIRNWIVWYEQFGVNCVNKFNRTSRPIIYAVKDSDNFVFNADEPDIRRRSARQELYDDPRANPSGKLLDDVWLDVPRLAGTHKERIKGFPTQLPLRLLRRIVLAASRPDDLIVDPFNGSGTTGAAALALGRRYRGIEKRKHFADVARLRLRSVQREFA